MISIIIPMYNSEKYIEKCIESILNNLYKNFEIIVVDDGSTDDSIKIVKKYTNIKLLYSNHAGPGSARNVGIENASGDFIFFLDSDDTINPNTLKILKNNIKKYDIVIGNYNIIYDNGDIELFKTPTDSKFNSFFESVTVWNRLYRKEFLNKYYVIEGNKRTSVLKYVDSPTIAAEVIRKVPRLTDDPEIQVYYEYMDFYRKTKISYVIFTKTGGYQKLCEYVGRGNNEEWTDDDRMNFSSFHLAFYNAYKALGGLELKDITEDDALLLYLSLYPYNESMEKLTGEIKKDLEKIWPEIKTLTVEEPVELLITPTTETSMIKKIQSKKVHKVAFVYDVPPSKSDWIYAQELGREHILDVFHGEIEAEKFIAKPYEEDEELFTELCEEGYDIIFAIAPMFIRACIKVAPLYPNTKILNCSLNSPHASIRTYGIRIYEGKFLLGMVAAAMSEQDDIGYLADYPIYGVIPGINAFTLGARAINPRARIHLQWSTMKDAHTDEYFLSHGISYISSQNMISPTKEDRALGLYHHKRRG